MNKLYDTPSKADVLAAQRKFYVAVGSCLAVLTIIHVLPKGVGPQIRFLYTVGFFAALLVLIGQMGGPLRRMLEMLFAWRYEFAPEPLERAWKSMLFSLGQLLQAGVLLFGGFFGSVALLVLAGWFPDLQVLEGTLDKIWYVTFFGILLFPILGAFLFQEVAQKWRFLSYESSVCRSFTPRPMSDLFSPEDDAPQELVIEEGLAFRTGGFRWHWNDFVQNCVVLGQIGSGKTSCVMNTIIDGVLGAMAKQNQRLSGLILDPKGTYYRDMIHLCQRYRRRDDLLVFNPLDGDDFRWNPLDNDDDAYEVASRFAAVSRSLGTRDESTSFWMTEATMFLTYAIKLVRLTNPEGIPPSFADINELVCSHTAICERAEQLDLNDPRVHDVLHYFAKKWAPMAPEQQSGVQAHLTGMIFPFLIEPYASRLAGKSTLRISNMVEQGKLLYLYMPASDKEAMARTIGVFMKLEFYQEVMKRPRKEIPSLFLCDEFQKFFTPGSPDGRQQDKSDADAFRLMRESNHANIIATQNLAALGQPQTAKALLANCLTGIFLRNPDEETNQFAASLFGQGLMGMSSTSMAAAGSGRYGPLSGQQVSAADQLWHHCTPNRFRELAVCSKAQAIPHCESIVFLGGRDDRQTPVRRLKWKRHAIGIALPESPKVEPPTSSVPCLDSSFASS